MNARTRNKILKWTVLTALLTYAAVMAAWAINCNRAERCVGIEVVIDNHAFMGDTVTRKGVISELARFDSKLIGKPLERINTRSIERFLTSFSNFESVQCFITSAGKLRIIVTPVIPELRVFDGDDSYYINKDGKRITANAKFYCDVPIVSGHFSDRFPATRLLPVVRRINADSVFKNLVMMIKADSPTDIILVPRVAGHVINIGDGSNLDTKLHNILLAYRDIMPYQGWEKYDTISVKFAGRIIASRRDKSQLSHTPEFEQSVDFDEDANDNISEGTEQAAAEMASALGNRPKRPGESRNATPDHSHGDTGQPAPAATDNKPQSPTQ